MQITMMHFVTECVDVHKNVTFSKGEILTSGYNNCEFNTILVSYDKLKILHSCSCITEFIKLVVGNR